MEREAMAERRRESRVEGGGALSPQDTDKFDIHFQVLGDGAHVDH